MSYQSEIFHSLIFITGYALLLITHVEKVRKFQNKEQNK